MTPEFNPNDEKTWPTLLTVNEIAQIRRLSAARINRLASEGRFVPAPTERLSPRAPRQWKREDAIRVFIGAKGKR